MSGGILGFDHGIGHPSCLFLGQNASSSDT